MEAEDDRAPQAQDHQEQKGERPDPMEQHLATRMVEDLALRGDQTVITVEVQPFPIEPVSCHH